MIKPIHVVGAGLAGSEAAFQLAQMGHKVHLYEMRQEGLPETFSPAHKTADFGELVCSNSFGSYLDSSAPGQLKWEMSQLGSMILDCAFASSVPAGHALSMDRVIFAKLVKEKVSQHPNITIEHRVVKNLDDVGRPAIIATGPLTHESLSQSMREHFGNDFLYFFDAIAPVIATDSIDDSIAYKADRWEKGNGGKDYYNCPLDKEEYFAFIREVMAARTIESKEFEKGTAFFEGCMPIEAMIERGPLTARFGPMKGKGLRNPATGFAPFAAVQLRQDNREATAYNMVGFQTKMSYADQVRVFRMIPGLQNAEFLKLGSMHRNLFLHTPKCLSKDLSSPKDPMLFFAGQITGVEGYFESTAIGYLVAQLLHQKLTDLKMDLPPRNSALGALHNAITDETKIEYFQPTNINFSQLIKIEKKMQKQDKRALQIKFAREAFTSWFTANGRTLQTGLAIEKLNQAQAENQKTNDMANEG
jgi:methylenetetrahydrofolate--tRNA-(uracil-5-)-methyltransferase